ncbi:PP2C family protein-serine/threonine phosphatase [Streptomyces sp. NPDC032472]|uniref:PP2C family protein-serine/threonine phosphatase n=1 Tax=Streptomyces sp. NPDC032472 TaxID=3155018 RepID=UPI0033DCE9CE
MSMHRPSGCPGCAEPLEEGDRFCGVCGSPVRAFPPPLPDDDPTLPIPTAAPRTAAAAPPAFPTAATGRATGRSGGPAGATAAGGVPAPSGLAAAVDEYPLAEPAPARAAGDAQPAAGGWSAPAQAAPQAGYGSGETRHDRPAGSAPSAADAPYGGTVPAPGHEAPYGTGNTGTGTPQGTGSAQGAGGKTCVACRAGRVDTDGYCEHCGHAQPRERDHLEEELCSVAAVSDRGLRHHRNEDSFAVAATALADGSTATVAIVCDGVSSASRPDEASAAAAAAANEALLEALPRGTHPQEAMHEAILAAGAAVTALAPEVPGAQNAPACTLVGAVVSGGLLTVGWVGDSRAYWIPDDREALPRRLTEDDSWAAQMVAAGLMGEAEAYADVRAHAITGWLGADAYDLEPHTATFKPDHAGVVLVCTDGLWNYAESAQEMAQVLPADAAARPLHSAQVLVGHALDGGGHDNVTVAVVPFAAPPGGEPDLTRPGVEAEPQKDAETETEAAARPRP